MIRNSTKRLIKNRISFINKFFFNLDSKNRNKIKLYKNIHKNERCFIIGSGPSVLKQDIKPLKNEYTFGFNAFFQGIEYFNFWPTYYLIEDILPAEDNAKNLSHHLDKSKFFLSHDSSKFYNKKKINCIYLNKYYMDHENYSWPLFSLDASKELYWGGTVTYMAIQLAVYMGFKNIYLIGIDLSYKLPKTVDGIIVSDDDDVNHFSKNYFGKGKRWHDPKTERMQRALDKAEQECNKIGVQLVNCTNGGNLKNLKRIDLKKVL